MTENESLAKSNVQYEKLIKESDLLMLNAETEGHQFAPQMEEYDSKMRKIGKREVQAKKVEKKLDADTNDLIEYTKWMNGEVSKMRQKVKEAEKVINDLRQTGQDSVEKLMENLFVLKMRLEEKEAEAESLRESIRCKEALIQRKENEKSDIKQQIEIDNAAKENEIAALRQNLEQQKRTMNEQNRLYNELQVLCDFTQNDYINAKKDLHKSKVQKQQLAMQYQEVD